VRARIVIALALAGALAGCQESGFDESKETRRPLKVQDAMNPLTGTKVPGQAKRPMTLSADTLGDTLALKVKPIRSALPDARVPAYLRPAARGVEVVAPLTKLDLPATEAAAPDVILGTKEGQGDLYGDLSKIAPTIMSEGDDWKLTLRLHGEGLGRTNDAEELLIDWDNRVARVTKAVGDRDLSVLLVRQNDAPASPGPLGESVLADLGIKSGRSAKTVLRIDAGPEWSGGGVLAARAALADVAHAL
jgi:ABC-type Fe3+-hydroxamate transport system substrate-binding protein